MSPIKSELIEVFDVLPEAEQSLLLEIARHFMRDDIATADDLNAIAAAQAEYAAGETVPGSAINWN